LSILNHLETQPKFMIIKIKDELMHEIVKE